jgi:hypothetical protein
MKKSVFILLAVLATAGLKAQDAPISASTAGTTKKMWLSGNAGFGADNEKDGPSSSNWNFGPSFGYFLNDKMAIGLGVGLNGGKTVQEFNVGTTIYERTDKSMGWQVAPFFRYYFAGTGNFRFFGDLYVAIGGGNNTTEQTTPGFTTAEVKYGTFGAGLRPGVQYWFNNNWSMASSIGILSFDSRTDDKGGKDAAGKSTEVKSSQLNLNANFAALNFAFYFHF